MSRDFGKISTSIWGSHKFLALADDAPRYLYLYLHTCPHGNAIGCFRLPKGYAMADLQWSEKDLLRSLKGLCEAGLIGWNEDESVVRILGFLAHSTITNSKHGQGAVKAALSLPDCEQKRLICQELAPMKYIDEGDLGEVLTKTFDRPIRTETETETETEIETEKETNIPVSMKPAIVTSELDLAVSAYNALAGKIGLPQVQKLTTARRAALSARLRDCGGLAGWDAALAKVDGISGLHGDNDRGWRLDFDFLTKESKFTKLMEGGYDHWTAGASGNGSAAHTEAATRQFREAIADSIRDDLPSAGVDRGYGSQPEPDRFADGAGGNRGGAAGSGSGTGSDSAAGGPDGIRRTDGEATTVRQRLRPADREPEIGGGDLPRDPMRSTARPAGASDRSDNPDPQIPRPAEAGGDQGACDGGTDRPEEPATGGAGSVEPDLTIPEFLRRAG